MSNLSDIGFPVRGEQDVNEMIQRVLPFVKEIPCPRGFYYKFADPSGAEIYLQANLAQELVGFNPHFAGKSRFTAGLTRAVERDSSELDGGFYAWANPTDKNNPEISGCYPFVFDVPDFLTKRALKFPQALEIQLTAFASNDFQIHESESAFYNAQETEPKFAAKHFIPSGLFAPDEQSAPIEPPRPIGLFAGEIKECELKTNGLTNENFYWFMVETYGGEVDVVADAKLVKIEPRIGGVVNGQFWLSGRLTDALNLE